ncbi:MAG: hypothetical protein COA45_03580 [Zetaproteobacteria bacterium]|nr:MAG: hypothetical protein COA45_03580 [Zetaproteobacteria bacterium]
MVFMLDQINKIIQTKEQNIALRRYFKKSLQDALCYDADTDLEDLLLEQAKVLDCAFRHIMNQANEYGDVQSYNAGLRAQNQFRNTAATIQALRKVKHCDDKKDSGHKMKTPEQTEGC